MRDAESCGDNVNIVNIVYSTHRIDIVLESLCCLYIASRRGDDVEVVHRSHRQYGLY